MRTIQRIQLPTEKAPMTRQSARTREWSRPGLHVNDIAAITRGGFSSAGVDNCFEPDGFRCQP